MELRGRSRRPGYLRAGRRTGGTRLEPGRRIAVVIGGNWYARADSNRRLGGVPCQTPNVTCGGSWATNHIKPFNPLPTARFPHGFRRCPFGSAASRETHRQIAVLARTLSPGCMLPGHYLHNRNRKRSTSQLEAWSIIHLRGEESPPTIYANRFRKVQK